MPGESYCKKTQVLFVSFERLLTPLFIDSTQALWAWNADREIRMDQTVSLVSGYVYSRFGHENVTYIGTDSELRK